MMQMFNDMDKIMDRLYLGNIKAASNYQRLKQLVIPLSKPLGNHPHPASSSWH